MEAVKKPRYNTNDEDKISKLPDFLIHHILSFVDIQDAVQTCILSKRWGNIWTSLPFLTFDRSVLDEFGYPRFLDFVDYVSSLRDNRCFDIRRFHLLGLYGTYKCDFIDRLRRWIIVVARSNVEDIDVQFTGDVSDDNKDFQVPSCVSTCKSLTKLELKLSTHGKIFLSNSISLPRLKYLKLENTSFNHDESLTKLCSSCPVLEHFDLSGVSSTTPLNITISSLTLKHFELHIDYRKSIHNTLRLCAPNLVHLVLSNLDYLLLEDVSSLVTADDVRRVLEQLEKQPFQFSNLQCLKMQKIRLSTDSTQVIASLLKNSPIVESLALELCQYVKFDHGYGWDEGLNSGSESEEEMESDLHTGETTLGLEGMFANTMKQLKSVEISGLEGSDTELKLIEILMKNAVVVKKMVLKKDPHRSINEVTKCRCR
ncbi:F-box/FBD/LRR-repeat protein At5g53840-like [Papaver somniferum]|uniref:F-box/FBD/LRR-repeat protein At5g53840-like n=1 Tax=Papaver somniferum TaxID=3469 RepID=UPI000E6FC27A|nr:F-box/FBD/LRR-repeat protein At5g53840-like [Papaver somniferum]